VCALMKHFEYLRKRLEGSAGVAELECWIDHPAGLFWESQQAAPTPQIAHGLSGLYAEKILDVLRIKERAYVLRPYCLRCCDQRSAPPELGGIPHVRGDPSESQLAEGALERLCRSCYE
jgi:hypothetical protein